MNTLNLLLDQLEAYISLKDKRNEMVSKASVGWQIDHSLKVFIAVCNWIENSNPADYKKQFNFWRLILFPLGYIPRGKARSPKSVLPPEVITTEDLINQLKIARHHAKRLKSLPQNAYFKHFIFGMLTSKQTLRFLEMHTNHHLKIIKDILKPER
ncbi:DUF1569 domain-containing protein [Aestuariivivens sediminis]|uniref:DUF1569 domain-containing protein n=1 Tax=Aestuariivivens sediminis TaxID=2913557 RepID=UPI001F57D38F|nr:DUF1569 domain-containing protein [Aestuariivivens sediminis]